MDEACKLWYYSDMTQIPTWQLYGETHAFPDIVHIETIIDRAAGLDWSIAPHRHLHLHQVFLLLSGTIRLTLDGKDQPVTPPMAINIPRGMVHGFTFSAGTEGFVLTLPADEFPELFAPPAESAGPLARAFTLLAADLTPRFIAVSDLYAAHQPFRRTRLRAETAALAAAMLAQAPETPSEVHRDPRIRRFEDDVLASILQRRTIESYASALSISVRHLSRLCKAETGLTAVAFIEALKMREACRLLVYTRMTTQQIAYHLGFEDPSYFGRVFQRNMGLAPGAYRKNFES